MKPYINIRKLTEPIRSPFWNAGGQFGWEGAGIGIAIHYFFKMSADDMLEVDVCVRKGTKQTLRINKGKAVEIIKKHNSFYTTKNGTKLVVLPLSAFEPELSTGAIA